MKLGSIVEAVGRLVVRICGQLFNADVAVRFTPNVFEDSVEAFGRHVARVCDIFLDAMRATLKIFGSLVKRR